MYIICSMGEETWVSLHKIDFVPMIILELIKDICRFIEQSISDKILCCSMTFLYLAISKPMWKDYPHLAMLWIVYICDGKDQYNVAPKPKTDFVV